MKTYEYPIIYWKLENDAIFGKLVESNEQLVANDIKGLRASFTEYIEKQLKDEEFFEPDIKNAKLKEITLKIRPHYHENSRIYPVKETVEIPVQAVYGSNEYGYFECFLPLIDRSFYFYDETDVTKLVEHFSKDIFHNLSPGDIYSLLFPTTPWLETITVKVPKPKEYNTQAGFNPADFPTLVGIAEKLPYSRREGGKGSPDAAWERSHLVEQLISLLTEEKSNVLLVGKSGSGKSAIINEAIRKIHSKEKSIEYHERRTFWRTTPARVTAKAKYLGEWQQICEDVVYELHRGNGIAWLENFVLLASTGGEGPEDSMAAFLTPFLRNGQLKMISELTQEQLEIMRRLVPGFVEHFRVIRIDDMPTRSIMKIFELYNNYTNRSHEINFSQKALELSYILLDRFVKYESFPGKAVRFLNSSVNRAMLTGVKDVDNKEIIENFTSQTGIPEFLLRDDVLLDSEKLRSFFLSKIKGQDHIIDRVISIIKVFKAGLNDPEKPISTIIFAGPTGVGKTATANAISEYFFGAGQSYKPLIRLDMSEFQHPSQIYRLIGPEGKLVQFVRERPFCVLLLDEIEKANPLIFDALLTVFDEGLLLDAAGRITDFRNTIIIMTSNLGSTKTSSLGFKNYQAHDYEADIKSFFRPEFYNRLDMCLIFNPLDEKTIQSIAKKELVDIQKRDGFKDRNIKLQFTENIIQYISEIGFDEKYGARPLQREIEKEIVAPIARLLIDDKELDNKLIEVDYHNEKITFELRA